MSSRGSGSGPCVGFDQNAKSIGPVALVLATVLQLRPPDPTAVPIIVYRAASSELFTAYRRGACEIVSQRYTVALILTEDFSTTATHETPLVPK